MPRWCKQVAKVLKQQLPDAMHVAHVADSTNKAVWAVDKQPYILMLNAVYPDAQVMQAGGKGLEN